MAADGDRNSEGVPSASVTHQVEHRNETLSGGDVYTTASTSFSETSSPALLGQTLLPLSKLTAKRRSQSADCSDSLHSGICEKEEINEEASSSTTQFGCKCSHVPLFTSAKRLCVLSEHLAVMRDGLHQGAAPILVDHSAITPFKRIDLMLLSNNYRDEDGNACTEDHCLSSAEVIKCGSSDYQERRRKNNDAARRSREARRTKEGLNRTRMVHLEEENNQLRIQIDTLRGQLNHMQLMLMASKAAHCFI